MNTDPRVVIIADRLEAQSSLLPLFENLGSRVSLVDPATPVSQSSEPTLFALELNAPSDNAYVYLEALLHRDRGVTFFAFGQGLGTAQVTRLMHQGALSVLERPLTREVVGPLVIGGIAHSVRRSEETQRWERIQTWLDELTPKEKAVALCAALSADNEQVALKLGCSVRTVEGNRVAINAKISRQAAKDLYASIATYLVVRTELKLPELTGVDVNGLVERSRLTPRW